MASAPQSAATLMAALCTALREKGVALRELEALRSTNQTAGDVDADGGTSSGGSSENTKCLFIDHIPREIRDMVYKNLLVNDLLADLKCISTSDVILAPADSSKYGLSPALLGVSKQINGEALESLYHSNTFIVDLQNSWGWFCPLNRRFTPDLKVTFGRGPKDFITNPLLGEFRHLKVLVGTDCPYEEPNPPAQQIWGFCRVLQGIQDQLKSLQIIVVPYFGEREAATFGPLQVYPTLRVVLRPFRNLRMKKGFEVVEGTQAMCTTSNSQSMLAPLGVLPTPTYKKHASFKKIKYELEALVRSDLPISKLPKMFDNLVRYVQAFERNPVFKEEMRPGYEEVIQRIMLLKADLRATVPLLSQDTIPTDLELLQGKDFKLRGPYSINGGHSGHPGHVSPFKSYSVHPLEFALEEASFGWERSSIDLFKKARRDAIEILELQYQRILAAALTFNVAVKNAKKPGNILGPATIHHLTAHPAGRCSTDQARLILLAEKYAQCFKRDIPVAMELIFRLQRNAFKLAYTQLPRELMLTKLDELYESRGSYVEIIETFKKLADDMDAQYLEIWSARKALFEHDDGEDAREDAGIDLEPNRCDQMVDWSVAEPDVIVKAFVPPVAPAPAAPAAMGNPFLLGNAMVQGIFNVMAGGPLPPATQPPVQAAAAVATTTSNDDADDEEA